MNLYLKYRPKTIDELDLSGVRKTLGEMVKSGNIAHAYLLTGPRGAGKTSTARVLARVVNCEQNGSLPDGGLGEPCNECSACQSILNSSAMDVIEIDAASNRGIDDIRELKEKIRLAPSNLRKKVYIIDEVHMLTSEAFNALLKTLEEPPSHSLFILCTTELHKVPETIVSRCARIQFTKATAEEMKRSFARVVAGEGVEAEEEALEYLAKAVDGSFRDGVKILDQVISHAGSVKLQDIERAVSGSSGFEVEGMISTLLAKNASESLRLLGEHVASGVDLNFLLLSLMRGLRDKLLAGHAEVNVTKLIFALDEVARRLATSLDGVLLIQVAIVEWCADSDNQDSQKVSKSAGQKSSESANQRVSKTENSSADSADKPTSRLADSPNIPTVDASVVWKQITSSLGSNNLALDTILSKARPGNIQGDTLTVYVQYDFHKQQLLSEKNRAKLEEMITKAVGKKMKVNVEIGESIQTSDSSRERASESNDGDGTIDEAIAIFS